MFYFKMDNDRYVAVHRVHETLGAALLDRSDQLEEALDVGVEIDLRCSRAEETQDNTYRGRVFA